MASRAATAPLSAPFMGSPATGLAFSERARSTACMGPTTPAQVYTVSVSALTVLESWEQPTTAPPPAACTVQAPAATECKASAQPVTQYMVPQMATATR